MPVKRKKRENVEAPDPNAAKTVVVRIYDEATGKLEQEHKGLDFVHAVMHSAKPSGEPDGADQFSQLLGDWGAFQCGHVKHIKNPAPLVLSLVTCINAVLTDYGRHKGNSSMKDLEGVIDGLLRKKLDQVNSKKKK